MIRFKTLVYGLIFSGATILAGVANAQGGPSAMSPANRSTISQRIRECLAMRHEAIPAGRFSVHLVIVTDASGTARSAYIVPGSASASSGTTQHLIAEKAIRALLDPQCSRLPLPRTMLGQPRQFSIIL